MGLVYGPIPHWFPYLGSLTFDSPDNIINIIPIHYVADQPPTMLTLNLYRLER